jgi:DNA polymerase-3 subunit alpha
LMTCYEEIMDKTQRRQRDRSCGQVNFLEQIDNYCDTSLSGSINYLLPDLPEWDHKELLLHEKETIGFYITGHPLSRYSDHIEMLVNADSSSLFKKTDHETVIMAGIVGNIREVMTKRKDTMAYITLEDLKGSISVIFFPDIYRNTYDFIHGEEPLLIKGTVDVTEDSVKVIASEVKLLVSAVEKPHNAVYFTIDVKKITGEDIEKLGQRLKRYPGKYDVFIRLLEERCETLVYLGEDIKVDHTLLLKKEADSILGIGSSQFL